MHILEITRLPRRVPDYPTLYYHYNTICTFRHFISLSSLILFFLVLCTMRRKVTIGINPKEEFTEFRPKQETVGDAKRKAKKKDNIVLRILDKLIPKP